MLVQIDYELHFATPFHMGTGISAGMIDRTVIHDVEGKLYVPGSTLKGVLREYCERLCRFYVPDAQTHVFSPHNAYEALVEFSGTPTLVSRIFGSQFYPGGLHFDDAKLSRESCDTYQNMQTSLLTQVRIDRMTRTAVDKALYTSEFGNNALTFEGTIKGQLDCVPVERLTRPTPDGRDESVPKLTYSLLLLLASLTLLERLGGNKSTGKGACNCIVTQVQLDGNGYTEQDWQFWLENLGELSKYTRNEGGQL